MKRPNLLKTTRSGWTDHEREHGPRPNGPSVRKERNGVGLAASLFVIVGLLVLAWLRYGSGG
jgi:hypothetical protein